MWKLQFHYDILTKKHTFLVTKLKDVLGNVIATNNIIYNNALVQWLYPIPVALYDSTIYFDCNAALDGARLKLHKLFFETHLLHYTFCLAMMLHNSCMSSWLRNNTSPKKKMDLSESNLELWLVLLELFCIVASEATKYISCTSRRIFFYFRIYRLLLVRATHFDKGRKSTRSYYQRHGYFTTYAPCLLFISIKIPTVLTVWW